MIKILSILLLLTSPVLAHDWYPSSCCGGSHCHPVPCDELIELDKTIKWKEFYFDKAHQHHPSQDNQCHVCIQSYNQYNKVEIPICVFTQQSY